VEITPSQFQTKVTTARVFAIAGPAMVANLTTPLIGIVSTTAVGRLGDAALLGGVAMASVIFDCTFWLFGFLRMSTLAFTAQAIGAGERTELPVILMRGFIVAALIGAALIALQVPLAAIVLGAMGGSDGVTRAAKTYFTIRIWSSPMALANYVVLGWLIGQARAALALAVQIAINLINMAATIWLVLVLDAGIAGAAIATVIAEGAGLARYPDRMAALAGTADRAARGAVRSRQADADARGQPRHHDPDRGTNYDIPVLQRPGRPRRRHHAGRQFRAEQFPAAQFVLPRRPR